MLVVLTPGFTVVPAARCVSRCAGLVVCACCTSCGERPAENMPYHRLT